MVQEKRHLLIRNISLLTIYDTKWHKMNNIQEYIGVLEDGCEETGGQKNNGESGKESFSEETDFKKQTDVRSLGAYGGFEEPTNAQDEQTGSSFEDIQDLDVKKPDIEICEQRPEFSTSITTIVPHKVTPVLPGVNNASASQNVLQIEETKQLDELNDVCGGDWQYLALLMPTADKKEMLGLDDKNAKQVTITYIVQDMIQRKQSFTVIMKDLIDRIRRIVSKEVHWACLIVRLKQTETLKLDDLTKLLEVVGDFETLWALLSMPCHTQENIGRNENEVRFPDMNELLKQLDIIVRKLEENGNLPTEDREKNKLCALLLPEFEPLLEIALSLGGKGLKQKFKRLSRMEKDKERFNIYLTSMGMEMIESKEILLVDRPHSECLFETHYIENCKMVGMPINRHGWGAGTLGFPIVRKGSNNAYAITSSHVMLIGEDVDLPTNSSRSIKIEHRLCWFRKCQLHCYQSDIEIGFVVFGYCELGNREKTGVEVVVLQMVEKRQHITENYIQYKNLQNLLISNWVFL
ncbi:uncharacterized protein LOC128553452, partial [Mercenaria mercenaria]|uniref:uncharacterized protein LOC128553452 n=1 Tax=Mercenaria mercenaria TaxID=6596 RepID=UPI00234F6BF7